MNTYLSLIGGAILAFGTAQASAAVLTTVPMQGSMVHVGCMYDADQGKIHTHIDAGTPALVPLDVSNPNDSFDPAQPWFTSLDPSQRSLAFNRQFGFVMDGTSDPLPEDTAIWIRLLSNSPALEFYTYRTTPEWTPMFGTSGSTNVLQWSLSMFHPAVAVPPVNGSHTATFEAFLVDLPSGQEIAEVAPSQFTLNWTSVATSRPALAIANSVVISWTTNASGYVLQSSDSLPPAVWTTVTNDPVILNGQNAVVLEPTEAMKVFRLNQIP